MIREVSRGNQATKRLMIFPNVHWMHQFPIIESIEYIEFPEESFLPQCKDILLSKSLSQISGEPYSMHETLSPAFSQFKSLNPTLLNPFQANVPFLYPLKTSENLWFSDVSRGYRKGTLAWNGSIKADGPLNYETNKLLWGSRQEILLLQQGVINSKSFESDIAPKLWRTYQWILILPHP